MNLLKLLFPKQFLKTRRSKEYQCVLVHYQKTYISGMLWAKDKTYDGYFRHECFCLKFRISNDRDFESWYPELWAQKPATTFNNGGYWFKIDKYGLEQRIKCLEEAIKLTYPLQSK